MRFPPYPAECIQFFSTFGVSREVIPRDPINARLMFSDVARRCRAEGRPLELSQQHINLISKLLKNGNGPAFHEALCLVRCACKGLAEENDESFPVDEVNQERFTELYKAMTVKVGLTDRAEASCA